MSSQSTILVVDDEPMARDVMEGFLFKEGYKLDFAANGAEALTYLEEKIPDVILLDVMMPEMDGYTVCGHVKANEQWRHVPIILVTALGGKEDLVRGLEAGADDFLSKPVDDVELRARVRSMLRIKKQYDELQLALRLREELAHMIVHDMRTPLSAILGFSGLLQTKGTLSPDDVEDVNKIYTQAHRLNSFLNDMLMVAKMEEAGHLLLNRTPANVSQLIQQVEKTHRVVAQLKRIDIVYHLPQKTQQVWVDTSLFQRVLDNLLSNALKFSPTQSTVTVQLEYLTENPGPDSPGPDIRLKVLDEGPGIPPEHRDRIFDKFEVVDLRKREASQVGLGLVFCKMAVEAHGGHIAIEDNRPTGSIFTVEI